MHGIIMQMKKNRNIEISPKSIFIFVLIILSIAGVYYIRDIIFQIYVSLLLTLVLDPFSRKLNKYKVPKPLSILLVYIIAVGSLIFSIAGIFPAVYVQTQNFVAQLPDYVQQIGISKEIGQQISSQLLSQVGNLPIEAVRASLSIVGNIAEVITVLTLTFYLLVIRDKIPNFFEYYFGQKVGKSVSEVLLELEWRLGGWVRGQLTLMIIVGVSTYIGLTAIGISYALPLAVIAGLLEAVPLIGPFLAAIPAVLVGFSITPLKGFLATGLAFLIQQAENYIFVPKVMERSVGVPPFATLVALAIGARFAGIVGVLLSVPTLIVVQVLLDRFLVKKRT